MFFRDNLPPPEIIRIILVYVDFWDEEKIESFIYGNDDTIA